MPSERKQDEKGRLTVQIKVFGQTCFDKTEAGESYWEGAYIKGHDGRIRPVIGHVQAATTAGIWSPARRRMELEWFHK
jgi:hypothetical protein